VLFWNINKTKNIFLTVISLCGRASKPDEITKVLFVQIAQGHTQGIISDDILATPFNIKCN